MNVLKNSALSSIMAVGNGEDNSSPKIDHMSQLFLGTQDRSANFITTVHGMGQNLENRSEFMGLSLRTEKRSMGQMVQGTNQPDKIELMNDSGRIGYKDGIAGHGHESVRIHASAVESSSCGTYAVVEQMEGQGLPGLKPEQWQALLATFGKPNSINNGVSGKFDVFSWIIDTGASNHVTGNLSCLSDVQDINPCSVGLPNGQKVIAAKEGYVHLSESICLSHVLFVPKLNCSLISVSQLAEDLDCFIQFTANICAIQDGNSRRLIGAGERRNGLYYFQDVSRTQIFGVQKGTDHVTTWHKRMGHPSETVMKWLRPVLMHIRDHVEI
ncbi:unnamed protein product, partial [Cuscuta epithymum]